MRRHHRLLLIFAIFVTVLVVVLYAYAYVQIGASIDRTAIARNQKANDEKATLNQQKLLQAYAYSASERGRLLDTLVKSDHIVDFIKAIEDVGKKSGATVNMSAIAADTFAGASFGAIGSVRASISAKGSWQEAMEALEIIENMPYDISVGNVSMSSSILAGKVPKREWTASFDIQAAMINSATTSTQ